MTNTGCFNEHKKHSLKYFFSASQHQNGHKKIFPSHPVFLVRSLGQWVFSSPLLFPSPEMVSSSPFNGPRSLAQGCPAVGRAGEALCQRPLKGAAENATYLGFYFFAYLGKNGQVYGRGNHVPLLFFSTGESKQVLWNWDKFAIPLPSLSLSLRKKDSQTKRKEKCRGGKTVVGL